MTLLPHWIEAQHLSALWDAILQTSSCLQLSFHSLQSIPLLSALRQQWCYWKKSSNSLYRSNLCVGPGTGWVLWSCRCSWSTCRAGREMWKHLCFIPRIVPTQAANQCQGENQHQIPLCEMASPEVGCCSALSPCAGERLIPF